MLKLNPSQEEGRNAIFLDILVELDRYTDYGKQDIAEKAQVHWTTLYAWLSGRTRKPRIDTLCRVALALGYDIVLARRSSSTVKLRRVK